MQLVISIEKQWSEILDTNFQLESQMTIPELLATEELEPNSKNYDKSLSIRHLFQNLTSE